MKAPRRLMADAPGAGRLAVGGIGSTPPLRAAGGRVSAFVTRVRHVAGGRGSTELLALVAARIATTYAPAEDGSPDSSPHLHPVVFGKPNGNYPLVLRKARISFAGTSPYATESKAATAAVASSTEGRSSSESHAPRTPFGRQLDQEYRRPGPGMKAV